MYYHHTQVAMATHLQSVQLCLLVHVSFSGEGTLPQQTLCLLEHIRQSDRLQLEEVDHALKETLLFLSHGVQESLEVN